MGRDECHPSVYGLIKISREKYQVTCQTECKRVLFWNASNVKFIASRKLFVCLFLKTPVRSLSARNNKEGRFGYIVFPSRALVRKIMEVHSPTDAQEPLPCLETRGHCLSMANSCGALFYLASENPISSMIWGPEEFTCQGRIFAITL